MKSILIILASVGVSIGATYLVVSNQKTREFNAEKARIMADRDAVVEKLERDLKRARGQAPRVETVTSTVEVEVDGRQSPQELINRLASIQPTSESDRAAQLREIIYLMESLRERGQESIPAISMFLAKNLDVDYDPPRDRGSEGGDGRGGTGGDGGFRGRSPGDFGGFRSRGGDGGSRERGSQPSSSPSGQ